MKAKRLAVAAGIGGASIAALTLLRGKVVVEGGALKGALSDGTHLSRKVADEVRSRPAV